MSPEELSGAEREPQQPQLRIYAASLLDYNNARLHGRWITLDGDTEATWGAVNAMLADSPTAAHGWGLAEEWAIHDYEGFGELHISEFESLERLSVLAGHLAEHGHPYLAWASLVGLEEATEPDASEHFEDAYRGEHPSAEEYGYSLLEDMGYDPADLLGLPERLHPYVQIDVTGWVRDMHLSGELDSVPSEESVYIFGIS